MKKNTIECLLACRHLDVQIRSGFVNRGGNVFRISGTCADRCVYSFDVELSESENVIRQALLEWAQNTANVALLQSRLYYALLIELESVEVLDYITDGLH